MLPVIDDDINSEFLTKELSSSEAALTETEKKFRQQEIRAEASKSSTNNDSKERKATILERLNDLGHTAESLWLVQDITEWISSIGNEDNLDIFQEAKICEDLAQILLRHENILEVCPSLYEEKYLPLYQYVQDSLIVSLRQELENSRYPSQKACAKFLKDCKQGQHTTQFPGICAWLTRLQSSHKHVVERIGEGYVSSISVSSSKSHVLVELFRPLVKRIKFHFVEQSEERPTSSRIDRLPEWLCSYVRENVLEGGPFDLVQSGLALADEKLPLKFVNELVRVIQWVLVERNFFRDTKICGQNSNPLLLCNAIEQLLQLDTTLRSLLALPSTNVQENRHIGLVESLVETDEDLMNWWIERERESVLSTLFDDAGIIKTLINHVSPRAEIFCALVRSVQSKASILSAPEPYLREVFVPLCIQFLDAVHDTSSELKHSITQGRGLPSESDLIQNLKEWIQLVNGTHMASSVLLREDAWLDDMSFTSQSDHDLARFGHSLERLVEEFAAIFVETVLMERAKLASYLMMASHLLASEKWDSDEMDLSNELRETNAVLTQFHHVCDAASRSTSSTKETGEATGHEAIALFAPLAMRDHVMNRLADKFLEVALDVHNMTPDIWHEGAVVFDRDSNVIMGDSAHPLVLRLLDITRLFSMDSKSLQVLFFALGGLVGASTFLDPNDFASDTTLYEEALSMVKAKGFPSIELDDALSILNRRRDLGISESH